MMNNQSHHIYIDPPSKAYYKDRLFDQSDPVLNRDDTLAPFIRVREALGRKGIKVHTADRLLQQQEKNQLDDYYSFGILDNYAQLKSRGNVTLQAFVIFEPPVVDPRLYGALPELTAVFNRVYVHNVNGDGYSLKGVDQSKLRKLSWPQPHRDVLDDFWSRKERLRRIVMINGNHKPASFSEELYSKRIKAAAALAKLDAIDLYGRGWERWWSRNSMWLPYWQHRKTLMSIYKGSCNSKNEILSQYSFALCFENMAMEGYVTEKIFDCLYSGTIPLYLGAKDISDLIPADVFVDCRKFSSPESMWRELCGMTDRQLNTMRNAGRAYVNSKCFLKYHDSLLSVVDLDAD